MNSFRALGNVQQATIAMVAPGIAEALVATAMGLFAAIPAVIAYNRFAHDVERLHNRYDAFVDEFSTILQRQAHLMNAGRDPEPLPPWWSSSGGVRRAARPGNAPWLGKGCAGVRCRRSTSSRTST